MALADHIPVTSRKPTGLPCSVGKLLAELAPDDRATLENWMRQGYSGRQIYDALKAEGHEVGAQTVNRHRSGACRCFR